MKKNFYCLLMLLSLALLTQCTHVTFSSPLQKTTGELPALVPAGEQTLQLEIIDNRPVKALYAGGLSHIDSGVFIAYSADPGSDTLAQYLERTGTEASQLLGFKAGPGGSALKVTLNDFWIDLYRFSGFSPMNCLGYGTLTVAYSAGPGQPARNSNLKVAYYENTTPAWSMEEVPREAMSRIYSQTIWETVGKTLRENGSPPVDAKAVERLMQMVDAETDDRIARELIFWLGLIGRDDPRAREKLLQIFRNTQEQRRRQAAVEALGMLGVQEARADIVDILSETRKIGYWSNNDAEEVFYLIKALAYLGEKDLQAFIPKKDFRARMKVQELVAFLNTGAIPEPQPKAKPLLEEVKEELKKK